MVLIFTADVFGSTTVFKQENFNATTSDVLSREKRFLTFVPNGGTVQFIMGYLGPIDIPLWQNINCLRNFRYQYGLPDKWATKFPHFPGLKARSLNGDSFSKIKPDSSRKIAYEVVETVLNKYGAFFYELS